MRKLASRREWIWAGTTVVAVFAASTAPLAGCSSTGIAVREAFGIPKREQVVDRVREARDQQQDTKQQFESTLKEFLAVTGAGSGDAGLRELEARYDSLDKQYRRCESEADAVRSRIRDVERVAAAMFREWEEELALYTSPQMRQRSEAQLRDTRAQYARLLGAMKNAESRMDPVLAAFRDQVLFLKHNLNARAIAGLQDTARSISGDVERLVAEMEASIAEANTFIQQLDGAN